MGSTSTGVSGVVLAGGRASRMGGRNKAFAAVGGEPIVARTLRVFDELFDQVIIATNDPDPFRGFGVEVVRDRHPGAGPLAGLQAAMEQSRNPHVFVAACDMPGLDPRVIRFLLRRIGSADAVVPHWDGDVEPLHAVYAIRTLPIITACLERGSCAMRDFLPLIEVDHLTEDELRALDGTADSFRNVNTPEDLAAIGGRFEDRDR